MKYVLNRNAIEEGLACQAVDQQLASKRRRAEFVQTARGFRVLDLELMGCAAQCLLI
jgi:hypothetical protein